MDTQAVIRPEVEVLVIGAGQAGLGTAYWLRRKGVGDVLVVEAGEVAQSWRERWASLELFTPRRFSSLPGRRFPPGPTRSPSRSEMADYLVSYAAGLERPVRTRAPVQRLLRRPDGFVASTPSGDIRARHVVVATGPSAVRACPPRPATWARPCTSCTRRSTARPTTCRPAPCWWWVAATRRRSWPSSCRTGTR
ncbi:FAD-dependent oxidoreductase [Blastococcus brunescens]|uniref:FAD-dependent oxidoreductase n=1 Tax=Blastococcus brunescens TaxID=1564165 RepID=A0ABZ1B174_9ACTN|nr:FAD-dependent oxidoreductase [Blastococcus sp. BMG 8361]WRL63496.1 FAD-dependent oxidoreductase [Blastococcus sp. BMG 8361]